MPSHRQGYILPLIEAEAVLVYINIILYFTVTIIFTVYSLCIRFSYFYKVYHLYLTLTPSCKQKTVAFTRERLATKYRLHNIATR